MKLTAINQANLEAHSAGRNSELNAGIKITRAQLCDVDRIIEFIRTDWRATHYFVKHPEFFKYHYQSKPNAAVASKPDAYLNFYIAEDNQQSLIGILGYLDYSMGEAEKDIVLSLWKVRQTSDPSLGMKMLETLKQQQGPRILACTGINQKTIPIYKFLRYQTGKMASWFLPNRNLTEFQILGGYRPAAIGNHLESSQQVSTTSLTELTELTDFSNHYNSLPPAKPSKSLRFIEHRYFSHPVFRYRYWLAQSGEKKLLIVTRVVSKQPPVGENATPKSPSIIRIVDLFGDRSLMAKLGPPLQSLLRREGAEYVEFVNIGVNQETLREAGFKHVGDEPNYLMPIYFQPFESRNIDIFYFASQGNDLCLFLGDGDQDRPN